MSNQTPSRRRGLGRPSPLKLAAIVLVVVVLIALLTVAILNALQTDAVDDPTFDGGGAPLSQAAFDDLEIGSQEDEVLGALGGAEAVVVQETDRYPIGPVNSTCRFYNGVALTEEQLYRLCFERGELVDKAVVRPEAAGG